MTKKVNNTADTFPMRGDIFYISGENATGCECRGAHRPAIIVSNDANNRYSSTVEVVYLTTRVKKPLPTHVEIKTAPRRSTALCEQITTVSKSRLESYVGHAAEHEIRDINIACAASLSLQGLMFDVLAKGVHHG